MSEEIFDRIALAVAVISCMAMIAFWNYGIRCNTEDLKEITLEIYKTQNLILERCGE